MPRQPRLLIPGTYAHLIARGNRRQAIFEAPEDYSRFNRHLVETFSEAKIPLIAHCPMPNHFHTGVKVTEADISRAMHEVLTSHALYMNKKYGRKGHLFEDRFKSIPYEGGWDLAYLTRYIHNNPIRGRLVANPQDWPWSTCAAYIDPASEAPPGKGEVLALFSPDPDEAAKRYAEFMTSEIEPEPVSDGPVPLEVLAKVVEREHGHCAGYLKGRSRRRDVTGVRVAFICKAADAGHRTQDIADFLGCSPSTVNWSIRRGTGPGA